MLESWTAGRALLTLRRRATLSEMTVGVFDMYGRWREITRQRRALNEMDDHILRDIGVDRATARAEADKPFWRG